MTQAGLALPLAWLVLLCLGLHWLALPHAPALSCPLSFSLNEKSLFIVSIERRDSPDKARHDTGKACLALGLACLAMPWLALACLAPAPALSCPLSFFPN
jgi:hypothetical protein